jgi:hypothetical protein
MEAAVLVADKPTTHLSPPQVARRYGVNPSKIIQWIMTGELRAINIAATVGGRPRWRISELDLIAFEQKRQAGSPPSKSRRRRQQQDVHNYF